MCTQLIRLKHIPKLISLKGFSLYVPYRRYRRYLRYLT